MQHGQTDMTDIIIVVFSVKGWILFLQGKALIVSNLIWLFHRL